MDKNKKKILTGLSIFLATAALTNVALCLFYYNKKSKHHCCSCEK